MTGGGFQTQVNAALAPASEGDWADANPRASVIAGPGGLVAGTGGVTVGRFAWMYPPHDGNEYGPTYALNSNGAGSISVNGAPAGIVHREQQALITAFLADASNVVPAGMPVTLTNVGSVWVKNNGSTAAVTGMKAYANYVGGNVTFAATGSPTTSANATVVLSAVSSTFTGSITGDVLTISNISSATAYPGGILSGTGIVTGTMITSQISGTTGGNGTYYVSIGGQSANSTTVTETYATGNVTVLNSGNFTVGMLLSAANVTAGSYVTAFISGTGGNGSLMVVTPSQTATNTVLGNSTVETKWYAASGGNAGELVKISTHTLG